MIHWDSTSCTLRRFFQKVAQTLFILLWKTGINSSLFIGNIQFIFLKSKVLPSSLHLLIPVGRFLFYSLLPRLNLFRRGKVGPKGFFERENMLIVFNECCLQNGLNPISIRHANKA